MAGGKASKATPGAVPEPGRALVFVYGTLMRGGRLHRHLDRAGAKFVANAKIRGQLYFLHGRYYPAAIPAGQRGRFVFGELYRLHNPTKGLRLLDEVEGCDEGLFQRRLVDVWADGQRLKAWTYFYARRLERARIIPTGAYRRRTA